MQGPVVIVKSGRHRAQSITLIENAEAVIIQKQCLLSTFSIMYPVIPARPPD